MVRNSSLWTLRMSESELPSEFVRQNTCLSFLSYACGRPPSTCGTAEQNVGTEGAEQYTAEQNVSTEAVQKGSATQAVLERESGTAR
eukprot:2841203-Rhodomonas_salina.2